MEVEAKYLQCLLDAEDLRDKFGMTEVPHGLSAQVYEKLLQGQAYQPPVPNQRMQLEDDLCQESVNREDTEEAGGGEAWAGGVGEIDPGSNSNIGGEDDINVALQELEAEQLPGNGSPPAQDTEDLDVIVQKMLDDAAAAAATDVEVSFRESAAADGAEAVDGALPSAPVASEQTLEAALRQGESLDWRGFFYGAFHFTPKKQAQWSWQAACPFHALNSKAGCRKAMNVTPVTREIC